MVWGDLKGARRFRRNMRRRLSPKSLTKKIKRVINNQAETKFIYNNEPGTAVSNAANLHECLTLCAEGDDYNNRTGNKIGIKKLEIAFLATIPTGQTNAVPLRVMVYRAKGDEFGALPNVGEVLDNSEAVAVTTANALQPWAAPGHKHEYTKLYDRTVMLGPNPIDRGHVLRFSKVFKSPLPVQYDLASAAIGAITSGHLFVLAMTTEAAGANAPVLHYMSRVSIVDY